MNNKILLLILLFCNIDGYCFAQQTTAHQDSAKFYRDIQDLSKRSKITKLIHRVFFKPIETPPPKPTISKRKNKVVKLTYYAKAEGKIIRDIVITTLDPFGYNVNDTAVAPRSFVQSTGNFLHIKTQRMAIKNLLLIRKNRPLDSLLIRESERLIRAQKYVRDVVVYASPAGNKSDSVDVFIRVLDAWSIDIALGASTTQQVSNLTDKDFGGLGHQFSNKYKWKYDGRYYYETNYLVPNIKKSYISVAGSYIKDEKKFETTSLDFERPFYSPFTKWAGGSYFAWHWYYDSLHLNDNTNRLQHFKIVYTGLLVGQGSARL